MSKLESMLLFLEALHENVRLAIRRLRRDPATSISILLLLCIGIGSSTAVFSVVDCVLFRRLPYASSDRLCWRCWSRCDTTRFQICVPSTF